MKCAVVLRGRGEMKKKGKKKDRGEQMQRVNVSFSVVSQNDQILLPGSILFQMPQIKTKKRQIMRIIS